MDVVGLAGIIVSVAGFGLALWQLHRTRTAAEAAHDAAREAVRGVRHVHAVATVQEICGRSRDLLHLTRARNLSAAANAAFELRDALARFRAANPGAEPQPAEEWTHAESRVASVHERLESAAIINRMDAAEREAVIHDIARVHAWLSSLAAQTAVDGGQRADS